MNFKDDFKYTREHLVDILSGNLKTELVDAKYNIMYNSHNDRYEKAFFVTNTDSKKATGDLKYKIHISEDFEVSEGDVVEVKLSDGLESLYSFTVRTKGSEDRKFFIVDIGEEVVHLVDIYEELCLDVAKILRSRNKGNVKINFIMTFTKVEYKAYVKACNQVNDEVKALEVFNKSKHALNEARRYNSLNRLVSYDFYEYGHDVMSENLKVFAASSVIDAECYDKNDVLVCYTNYGLDVLSKNLKVFTDRLAERNLKMRGLMYTNNNFVLVPVRDDDYYRYQGGRGFSKAIYLVIADDGLGFESKEELAKRVYDVVKCIEDEFGIRAGVFAGSDIVFSSDKEDHVKDRDYKFIKYGKGNSLLLSDVKNHPHRYRGNFMENIKFSLDTNIGLDGRSTVFTVRKSEKEVVVYDIYTLAKVSQIPQVIVRKHNVNLSMFTENECKYAFALIEGIFDDDDFDSLDTTSVLERIDTYLEKLHSRSKEEYANTMASSIYYLKPKLYKDPYIININELAELLDIDLNSFTNKLTNSIPKEDYVVLEEDYTAGSKDWYEKVIDGEVKYACGDRIFCQEIVYAFEANDDVVYKNTAPNPIYVTEGEFNYKIFPLVVKDELPLDAKTSTMEYVSGLLEELCSNSYELDNNTVIIDRGGLNTNSFSDDVAEMLIKSYEEELDNDEEVVGPEYYDKNDILVCYTSYGLDVIYENLKEFKDILSKRNLKIRGLMHTKYGFVLADPIKFEGMCEKYFEEHGYGRTMYLVISNEGVDFTSKSELAARVQDAITCVEDKLGVMPSIFAGGELKPACWCKDCELDGEDDELKYEVDIDYGFMKYEKSAFLYISEVKNDRYKYKGNFIENIKPSVVEAIDKTVECRISTIRKAENEVVVYEIPPIKNISSYPECMVWKNKVDPTMFTENECKYAYARALGIFATGELDSKEVIETMNELFEELRLNCSEDYHNTVAGLIWNLKRRVFTDLGIENGKKLALCLGVDLQCLIQKLVEKMPRYSCEIIDANYCGNNFIAEIEESNGISDAFLKEMIYTLEVNEDRLHVYDPLSYVEINNGDCKFGLTRDNSFLVSPFKNHSFGLLNVLEQV